MKLFFSPTSPYVRKVVVLASELGLDGRIERVAVKTSPTSPDPALGGANPLRKIPTLVTDEGEALYDSPVICEYLDTLHSGPRAFPPAGPARWRALRLQALADGLLDAAVLVRYEVALRPEERRWAEWLQGQLAKVDAALDALEAEAATFAERVDIGTISAACALGYLDFRFAAHGWRSGRPRLAAWYERFAARPSLVASRPVDG